MIARRISVRNHNRLLWNFDGAIGGKTGYTFAAQKCFVGAVQRNGVTMIVSILGSRDLWGDTRKLLEYGFDHYQTLKGETGPGPKDASGEQAAIPSDQISALMVPPQDDERKLSDGYVLQVGAFRERGRAESLSKQIGAMGFDAFVEEVLSQGETTYRVRVGPYTKLSQAQESAHELLTRRGYRALILPVPTTLREKGDRS